ncbi:uncharacterized protein EV420DRAFT_1485501 [Desarmillaria tabescens]|uniref:Uncharacterized protein n=1 Tax=Armillaria tabescens TaxID=1929756 RepID=A0AA39JFE0_ARMTA|nr:uncharacterized protein EV420DRAFT_1485501 [Desarmillaria tabescens]KAK0441760.1 hypothetical protein EV420DRAFT_1485501 [Desarmillaria tabescens]
MKIHWDNTENIERTMDNEGSRSLAMNGEGMAKHGNCHNEWDIEIKSTGRKQKEKGCERELDAKREWTSQSDCVLRKGDVMTGQTMSAREAGEDCQTNCHLRNVSQIVGIDGPALQLELPINFIDESLLEELLASVNTSTPEGEFSGKRSPNIPQIAIEIEEVDVFVANVLMVLEEYRSGKELCIDNFQHHQSNTPQTDIPHQDEAAGGGIQQPYIQGVSPGRDGKGKQARPQGNCSSMQDLLPQPVPTHSKDTAFTIPCIRPAGPCPPKK